MLRWIAFGLLIVSFASVWQEVPRLPPQIPMHFNASGQPDRWGAPDSLWTLFGIEVLLTVLFASIPLIGRALPQLIHFGDRTLADTTGDLRLKANEHVKSLFDFMMLISNLLFLFLIADIIHVAHTPGATMPVWPVGAFVAATIGGVIWFLKKLGALLR